jgi:hypothetical protein
LDGSSVFSFNSSGSFFTFPLAIHSPARSDKANGIVIEAKMRAGRRRKLFRQETDWRKTVYAGVSVISMMSGKPFADQKMLIESADKKEDLLTLKTG